MAIKISHLPDELVVDDEIVLRAKSSVSFPLFAEVIVKERDNLSKWLPWAIDAPNQSSIDHYNQAPEKKKNNESLDYDIFHNEQYVGAIGAMNRTPENTMLELGYWLSFPYRGQGIVSRSVNSLTDMLFELTDTPAIQIAFQPLNAESKAVAVRAGYVFQEMGTCTPSGFAEPVEANYHWITREVWEEGLTRVRP